MLNDRTERILREQLEDYIIELSEEAIEEIDVSNYICDSTIKENIIEQMEDDIQKTIDMLILDIIEELF